MDKKTKQVSVLLISSDDEAQMTTIRLSLKEAMIGLGMVPCWSEKYPGIHKLPGSLMEKDAPMILINEKVYWQSGKEEKTPSVEALQNLIVNVNAKKFSWKKAMHAHLSFLLAVLIAFFPKCPFCWAAYMSVLGTFGIEAIPFKPWLLFVLIGILVINIAALYFSRKRHGYRPMLLALTGGLIIVLNRLYIDERSLIYLGALCMITASLWTSLPIRMVTSLKHYFRRWFGIFKTSPY